MSWHILLHKYYVWERILGDKKEVFFCVYVKSQGLLLYLLEYGEVLRLPYVLNCKRLFLRPLFIGMEECFENLNKPISV